jgi:DNA-binding transcriptional LysR family regulator
MGPATYPVSGRHIGGRSITDAAIALGISQPQASRVLRSLEASWGVRLITRSSRRTILTAQGRLAAERGRHLLAFAEAIKSTVRGEQIMRLGYTASVVGRRTPALQRRWRDVEPEMDLRLISAKDSLAGMAEGLTDAAVLRICAGPAPAELPLHSIERALSATARDGADWGRSLRVIRGLQDAGELTMAEGLLPQRRPAARGRPPLRHSPRQHGMMLHPADRIRAQRARSLR